MQKVFVISRPEGCRTSQKELCPRDFVRNPSPRPSPQGRGRIVASPSANRRLLEDPSVVRRDSLSPGERAGVRGNGPRDQKRLRKDQNLTIVFSEQDAP